MTFDFMLTALGQTRRNMENILDAYTLDQLNAIPSGYRNNLIWNYGHVIVTQQLLCYKLAGFSMQVADTLVDSYRKGSVPDPAAPVSAAAYDQVRQLSEHCLDTFAKDLSNGLAEKANYQPYATSYGVTLRSIDEAAYFNLAHEALHLGTMLAMRKVL